MIAYTYRLYQFPPRRVSKNGVNIPKYDGEELKKVSIGAGVLLGGIGGAALGTAGAAAPKIKGSGIIISPQKM